MCPSFLCSFSFHVSKSVRDQSEFGAKCERGTMLEDFKVV